MKHLAIKRSLAVAALGVAVSLPASATPAVIDFESLLPTLFFPGDTFTEAGFRMTVDFDLGTVDGAGFLPAPTSGNNTQVYGQFNDGGLIVEREDGLNFDLNSFDYAFIPQNPQAVPTAIIALAEDALGVFGFGFAFASAVNGANPFVTANTAGLFDNIRWVQFFSCSLVGGQLCTAATQNSGQFAVDNINVNVIPEPTSVALVLGALMAAGFSARRKVC